MKLKKNHQKVIFHKLNIPIQHFDIFLEGY